MQRAIKQLVAKRHTSRHINAPLTKEAVLDIIGRFATAMQKIGAEFDKAAILADAESKLG